MSHICVYLGKGGCLLKIPFRYLEIIGWSESFENPLMHTTLDRALLAPHSPLYRQPLVYTPCKNDSTLSTDVSMGSSFLDSACSFHFLRIASYFDFVVFLHDCDNFCNLFWSFYVSDCFPDNRAASSLNFGNSGCVASFFDGKINNFMLLGNWSGKSCSIFSIKGNQN